MSLEAFHRAKLVVLSPSATAYQAARAMADNHIGAILVSEGGLLTGILTDRDLAVAVTGGGMDPGSTPLSEVMSADVATCRVHAPVAEAVGLMIAAAVRRIPLLDSAGRLAGLVTFDDLLLAGAVGPEDQRAIVAAQLEAEAPLKPAGVHHPVRISSGNPLRARMRARARAEQIYARMLNSAAEEAGLEKERAERALQVTTCLLCRRATPDEARHVISQLPSLLHPMLESCLDGPDRAITAGVLRQELARVLGEAADAGHVAAAMARVLVQHLSPAQAAELQAQLPSDLRALFPEDLSRAA